jgi:peptidase M1-like protein
MFQGQGVCIPRHSWEDGSTIVKVRKRSANFGAAPRSVIRACLGLVLAASISSAAAAANSDPAYQALRNITTGGKAIAVKNFVLKRDAGTFTFTSGNFFFLTPVEGKTTGAVFIGTATFSLDPPLEAEKHSLGLLTKSAEMVEQFKTAVFRFTDGTETEIEARGSIPTGITVSQAGELLGEVQKTLRKNLQYNLDARILQDVLSTQPGSFFCAFIKGQKYSGKEIYVLDPHGVPADFIGVDVAPEEVAFYTYDDKKAGVWTAFHYQDEYKQGKASGRQLNESYRIVNQKLDVTIEKNGHLTGTATTTILPLAPGMRVVPLRLFHKLRVETVVDEDQRPLSFIQEKKDEDYQFSIILASAAAFGKRLSFTTHYSGPDAVFSLGWGAFYPAARTSWYPNTHSTGNYATYEVTFRIPKGLTMVATGTRVADSTEGDFDVSQWKTDVPVSLAGFNFGQFKKNHIELPEQGITLENYANADMNLDTTKKMQRTMGEGQLAIPLYTDYFGPIPYRRLGITEQPAFYGQSFANLVFLPIVAYMDASLMNAVGHDAPSYYRAVGPHEIAHQWWGNTVGWISYRDQWMGEGFAQFSASLFLQTFFTDGTYDKFWETERKLLVEKDQEGFRPIDVGPVTLGYRLGSTRAGFEVPLRLIYPKGCYILNMIRMMMWSNDRQDADFKGLMHDFVQVYTNHPATTEDFKLAVEQHMNPSMNLTGDGKMDWFFNGYVYGTALPNEKFSHSFSNAPDGTPILNFKVEQSGVDSTFRMSVPVYIELPDGGAYRVGAVPLTGNTTVENQIVLRGLKSKPKRAMINYYHDVLCIQN